MKKILLFIFYIFSLAMTKAYCQSGDLSSFIPAAPQKSSSTTNYGADYYTGRLNYSAPLSNVTISGINFPISLNYTTNGVKVQDISGVTGLGWSSSLGGSISRDVHGLPDEQYNGYCGTNRMGGRNYEKLTKEYLQNVANGDWDSQPDKFYFSFLGFTGSFVLDPDGKPVLQSKQTGIKIDYCPFKRNQSPSLGIWILRDQQGNRYYFERTQVMSCVQHGLTKNQNLGYTSAWSITKIITANNQEIDYTYSSGSLTQYTNYLNIRRIDRNVSGGAATLSCLENNRNGDITYNENIDISYPSDYLTKISGNGIDINLYYNLTRIDLNNIKALTDISVNYNNKSSSNYKFNYDYFTSSDGTNTKRLKLNSISQVYPGNILKTLYSFSYNEVTNLPARNSIKTDYLGFYNNNTQNSNISGYADKTPNLINSQANILQKVTNILGGSINFEYELNNYADANNQNIPAPGLRIKRIYEKRNESDATFSNQSIFSYNVFGSTTSSGQVYNTLTPFWDSKLNVNCSTGGTVYYYSSEALESLTDENSVNVGYSSVSVSRSDGSSARYTFTNYSDYSDKNVNYRFDTDFSTDDNNVKFNNVDQKQLYYVFFRPTFFGPTTSYSFARGKVLKEELVNAGGQTVKTTIYAYSLTNSEDMIISLMPALVSAPDVIYNILGFTYFTQDLRLDSKTVLFSKVGFSPDPATGIYTYLQSTKDTYTYTTYAPNLLKNVTTTRSGGEADKVAFRYAFDVFPTMPSTEPDKKLPLNYLVYTNNIANPIEVVHSVIRNTESKIVSANVTSYRATSFNTVAPYSEYKLDIKSPIADADYIPFASYNNGTEELVNTDPKMSKVLDYVFDAKGNQLQNNRYVKALTLPVTSNSSIYGYDGMYKIADVSNASQSNVAYTSFESNDKGNWVYAGTPIFDLYSATGTKYYDLSKGSLVKTDLTAGTTYLVSYWTKNTNFYTILGTQGTPLLLANRNGWRCYQHIINNQTGITISGTGFIDEVRLNPVGSKMVTYTYEPFIGITSKTDENAQTVYSEYDEYNRLQYVRDNERIITQAYCYNLNGELGNCFTSVTNQLQSRPVYKNDCGPGVEGSSVSYQVPAGRYFAKTQQTADALAQIEIDQNGQNYANANGSCSSLILYARIVRSNYAYDSWSNPSGESGSSSIADVSINFYSDAGGTVPFVITRPITVIVAEGFNTNAPYNGSSSGSNNASYQVAAGQSSLSLGRHLLSSYGSYIDPYSGSGLVYESSDYSYDVVNGDNSYIPLSTL